MDGSIKKCELSNYKRGHNLWVVFADPYAAIPAIIGDALGDVVAASRKKKRFKKKMPVNI